MKLRNLLSVLRQPKGRRVVVVSDRYPPDSRGGAELSLHIVLRGMDLARDLVVVTFGEHLGPQLREVDGIQVLSLPRQPPLGSPFDSWLNVLDSGAERESRTLLHQGRRHPAPRGGVPDDFVELRHSRSRRQLRWALRILSPALIHADNYRAIALVASATGGVDAARVGLIRDNRFHCVRYDQSATIRGTPCGSCDLACATHDAPANHQLQRRLLSRSREFRHGALRRMDRVVVTSRYLQDAVSGIVPRDRIERIPNAADDLAFASECFRGIAERPGTNLLVVGMLNENKGQVQVVRHLRRLVDAVPNAVVHFAGRGERIAKRLREIALEQGLPERVVLHGYLGREQLYRLYRECQIVVLPTVWPEPFGRVPLEAGLARRPVVSYAVGGLKESIVDGTTGYLVPPGDMDRMIARIQLLSAEPQRRYQMGAAAHAHVRAGYGVEASRNLLSGLWNQLLRERGGVGWDVTTWSAGLRTAQNSIKVVSE